MTGLGISYIPGLRNNLPQTGVRCAMCSHTAGTVSLEQAPTRQPPHQHSEGARCTKLRGSARRWARETPRWVPGLW